MTSPVLAVAHRAGNSRPALTRAVALGVDVVEADVHWVGSGFELRHSRRLGPLPWLWDRSPWQLTRRPADLLSLQDLIAAPHGPAGLMLDLKGVGPVGRRAAAALERYVPRTPVLVCARHWPSVAAFASLTWARPVLSARNRGELLRLRRRLRAGAPPYGVSLHPSLLTAPLVRELRDRVDLVMTWGVNDAVTLDRVLSWQVNGVITDNLALLPAIRARRQDPPGGVGTPTSSPGTRSTPCGRPGSSRS